MLITLALFVTLALLIVLAALHIRYRRAPHPLSPCPPV